MTPKTSRGLILLSLHAAVIIGAALAATGQKPADNPHKSVSARDSVLYSREASKLLPVTLFFRGEETVVESRNSGGIQFPDGMYLLAAVIETSGHAAGLHEVLEACFFTEVPLNMNGHALQPGVYEIGVDDRHHFTMMDIAARPMFVAESESDLRLLRPKPLQMLSDSLTHDYRLYVGREYVTLSRVHQQTK